MTVVELVIFLLLLGNLYLSMSSCFIRMNALIYSILEHEIYMYSCMLPGESKDADIWKDELQFSIQYHARACIYITKQWLEATNPISPVEIAERVYQNMPEPLKEALKERNRV